MRRLYKVMPPVVLDVSLRRAYHTSIKEAIASFNMMFEPAARDGAVFAETSRPSAMTSLEPTVEIYAMLKTLKAALRSCGMSSEDIAREMRTSLRTVMRWFQGKGLDLVTLSRLCALAGLSLAEVFEMGAQSHESSRQYFTVEQELALASDSLLSFLFVHLNRGWALDDLQREAAVSQASMAGALARLERLGLVRCLPSGRVKVLVPRNIEHHPNGPIARALGSYYESAMLPLSSAEWRGETLKLSRRSFDVMKRRFHELEMELRDMARRDHTEGTAEQFWCAVLFAIKPMDRVISRPKDTEGRGNERLSSVYV